MAGILLGSVGFVGQVYSGAVQAYLTLQAAIDFPETAEKLVLQLEVERIRLQLWGENSGANEGILHPGVSPFEPLIKDILNKVTRLLHDSNKLKEDYGLVGSIEDDGGGASTGTQKSNAIDQVKVVFRAVFPVQDKRRKERSEGRPSTLDRAETAEQDTAVQKGVSSFQRIRWAISSQSRFERLIRDIRGFTNNLNELLRESQQVSLSQDWRRLEIQMVADIDDTYTLQMVQAATQGDDNCRNMSTMARMKSIVSARRGMAQDTGRPADITVTVLSKHDFDLPVDFRTSSRCIALHKPRDLAVDKINDAYVLIEKKHYDEDISSEDKAILLFRLHRLVSLLNSTSNDHAPLLYCLGYWSEPESNCWCLAYLFPVQSIPHPPTMLSAPISTQPLSLLHFLESKTCRPPLESRLVLASTIAGIFSQLYGSKWLHKGVRSENILFPFSAFGTSDISTPLIAGFEYSRQYTEQASIDHTPYNLSHAIYRHPHYQGLAAKGYRMAYDVYSFGLVLAEIAWWIPLKSFLQVSRGNASEGQPTPFGNQRFGAKEATQLSTMVISRLNKELAFRVGTAYKDVVRWCLCLGGHWEGSDKELAVEFYTNVVAPLEDAAYRRPTE